MSEMKMTFPPMTWAARFKARQDLEVVLQGASRAEHELAQILTAYALLSHGERVSLDNLAAPLNTALIRAEGAMREVR